MVFIVYSLIEFMSRPQSAGPDILEWSPHCTDTCPPGSHLIRTVLRVLLVLCPQGWSETNWLQSILWDSVLYTCIPCHVRDISFLLFFTFDFRRNIFSPQWLFGSYHLEWVHNGRWSAGTQEQPLLIRKRNSACSRRRCCHSRSDTATVLLFSAVQVSLVPCLLVWWFNSIHIHHSVQFFLCASIFLSIFYNLLLSMQTLGIDCFLHYDHTDNAVNIPRHYLLYTSHEILNCSCHVSYSSVKMYVIATSISHNRFLSINCFWTIHKIAS